MRRGLGEERRKGAGEGEDVEEERKGRKATGTNGVEGEEEGRRGGNK